MKKYLLYPSQVELVNDNLYEWYVRLKSDKIDPDSLLAEDLVELNIPHILLHIIFPENFPFSPPFLRVVEPRIEKGYVMEGGAICLELLTPRGNNSHSIASFFVIGLKCINL